MAWMALFRFLCPGAADVDGDAVVLTNVLNFVVDATAPSMTDISASPGALSAVITWNTSEPATSQVDYGATASYGAATPFNGSLVTSPSVTINGLSPVTAYHFRVRSLDLAGNAAVSADNALTTLPAPRSPSRESEHLPCPLFRRDRHGFMDRHEFREWRDFWLWHDQVTVSNTATGQIFYSAPVYYDPPI